ncbi:hypothetical protein EON63_22040 [archaeon]|nr:MAG: hypothetical protein EON63_22040 [archaeon]
MCICVCGIQFTYSSPPPPLHHSQAIIESAMSTRASVQEATNELLKKAQSAHVTFPEKFEEKDCMKACKETLVTCMSNI